MVQVRLKLSDFENRRYVLHHGDKEVQFIIVDEEFQGANHLGKINRMVILINNTTIENSGIICSTVIGFGNPETIGIKTDNAELRGKLLNKDNMEECVIELYEEGDFN